MMGMFKHIVGQLVGFISSEGEKEKETVCISRVPLLR